MLVIFIGKPGSGKDTICRKLSEKHKWPLIVTGDLLREESKKETDLGKKIAPILARGELVKDEIVIEIIGNKLFELKENEIILLNGCPRTLRQAILLDEKLSILGMDIGKVIELSISDKTSMERLILRRYCPVCGRIYNLKFSPPKEDEICDEDKAKLIQREDDKEEVIKHRLKRFYDEITGIIEYYSKKGVIVTVDAERSVDDIASEVENIILKDF